MFPMPQPGPFGAPGSTGPGPMPPAGGRQTGNPFGPKKPPLGGAAPKKKASGSKPSAASRAKAKATSKTKSKSGSGKPPRF